MDHERTVIDGVLGTMLDLWVAPRAAAAATEAIVLAEIERLELVFSIYRDDSELTAWNAGSQAQPSADLAEVLEQAQHWKARSGWAFDHCTWALSQRWRQAERDGVPPRAEELKALLPQPPERVGRRFTCPNRIDLNSIAKGYIVDRALDEAWAAQPLETLLVNLGGDLRHRGSEPVVVSLEDPRHPYDNAPPLARIRLGNRALATSGWARRGFRVAGHWLGHVLDPRTGFPIRHTLSATVVAPDTLTSDAVATIVSVLPRDEALAFVADLPDVEALIVGETGAVVTSPGWEALRLD